MEFNSLADAQAAASARIVKYELLGSYLVTVLRNLLVRAEIGVDLIDVRTKSVEGILRKMERKGYQEIAEVKDICGVRIVVQHLSDIERVQDLIRSEFMVEEEWGHGAASADVFGYSGFHMNLKLSAQRASLLENEIYENLTAEVQIRTILQHAWASISHRLDYKSRDVAPEPVRRSLHSIAALLEIADKQFETYKSEVQKIQAQVLFESDGLTPESPVSMTSVAKYVKDEDWLRIEETAERAGWRNSKYFQKSRRLLTSHAEAVERLVAAARECKIETIGALVAATHDLDARRLTGIRERAERADYAPYALGPDVVSFYLMSSYAKFSPEQLARLSNFFRPELLNAAVDS